MNTKDIVLVGVGVLAGHLLATYLRKKRENNKKEKLLLINRTELSNKTIDKLIKIIIHILKK